MQLTIIITLILLGASGAILFSLPTQKLSLEKRISLLLCAVVASITLIDHQVLACLGEINTWMQSLIHALKAVGLSDKLDEFIARIFLLPNESSQCIAFLRYYTIVLYILAPLCASALLLKILSGLLSRLRMYTHVFRPIFVFSRLSNQSVTFAENLYSQYVHLKPLLVFENAAEDKQAFRVRLKPLHALLLPDQLTQDELPRFAHGATYLFMDENESVNLLDMMRLLERPDKRRIISAKLRLRLYVFTKSRMAEDIVTSNASKYQSDRIPIIASVNADVMLSMSILSRYPLVDDAYTKVQRPLDILLVGDDSLTETFLETAFYTAQLPYRTPRITVAARDENELRRRFLDRAPMLLNREDPAVMECGSISFISANQSVPELFSKLPDLPEYVFISCGSDEDNHTLATHITDEINRRKIGSEECAGKHSVVLFRIQDSAYQAFCKAHSDSAQTSPDAPCRAIPVGSLQECLDPGALFGERITVQGFFLNCAYEHVIYPQTDMPSETEMCKSYTEYMQMAYQRRSSMASALHLDYRSKALRAGISAAELSVVESRRWNAYMMIEGYTLPSACQEQAYMYRHGNRHVCHELRLHPCIVPALTPMLDDLWQSPASPDPLDQLSIRLHQLVTDRLEEVMACDEAALKLIPLLRKSQTKKSAAALKKQLQAHAAALPETFADKAQLLCKDLYRDMKAYDSDIVSHTNEIIAYADRHMDLFKSCWLL